MAGPCMPLMDDDDIPLVEDDDDILLGLQMSPAGQAMEASSHFYIYRTSHKDQTLLDLQQLVKVLNSRQPRDEVKEQVLVLLEANPGLVAAYRRSKIRL